MDSLICSPVLFTISFFSRVREQFSNHSILYPEGRAFISVSDKCLSIQLLVLTKILVFFKALKKRSGMHQCDLNSLVLALGKVENWLCTKFMDVVVVVVVFPL